jgi:hypothetical protein
MQFEAPQRLQEKGFTSCGLGLGVLRPYTSWE